MRSKVEDNIHSAIRNGAPFIEVCLKHSGRLFIMARKTIFKQTEVFDHNGVSLVWLNLVKAGNGLSSRSQDYESFFFRIS